MLNFALISATFNRCESFEISVRSIVQAGEQLGWQSLVDNVFAEIDV